MTRTRVFTLMSTAAVLVVTGCAPSTSETDDAPPADQGESTAGSSEAPAAGSGSVDVGIIYSETGPLAAYGKTYREGLEAGIDYATDGTGEVDGIKIEVRRA